MVRSRHPAEAGDGPAADLGKHDEIRHDAWRMRFDLAEQPNCFCQQNAITRRPLPLRLPTDRLDEKQVLAPLGGQQLTNHRGRDNPPAQGS